MTKEMGTSATSAMSPSSFVSMLLEGEVLLEDVDVAVETVTVTPAYVALIDVAIADDIADATDDEMDVVTAATAVAESPVTK